MNTNPEDIQKFEKSASQIKKQIEFRFLKQSGDSFDRLKSYQNLSLFDSFPLTIRNAVNQSIKLNQYELPVILNYIDDKYFVLFTTERIHFKKRSIIQRTIPLKEIKHGFFEFHNRTFEGMKSGESRPISPSQNRDLSKVKTEGYFLNFELAFDHENSMIFQIPTGSAAYSLINTLNVLRIAGTKYIISDYKETRKTI